MPTTCCGRAGSTEVSVSAVSTGSPPIHSGQCLPRPGGGLAGAHALEGRRERRHGSPAARSRRAAGSRTAPGRPRRWAPPAGRRCGARSTSGDGCGARTSRSWSSPSAKVEPQERLVGRVLEQPPHEVGHAGDELADGRVFAHAAGRAADGRLDGLAHAVQHLQLVGVFGQAREPPPWRWRGPASARCGWRRRSGSARGARA